MGKYTMEYDTLKIHNNNCYNIPKRIIRIHKYLRHWLIEPSEKKFVYVAEVIHYGASVPIFEKKEII